MNKLIVISFLLATHLKFSYQNTFKVERAIFSPDSSVRIQTSQDTFTNLDPSAKKSCSKYTQSYCVEAGCNECKCFYNTNFYSLYDGCLTHTEIFAKQTKEPRCDFGFSTFTSPSAVPTLINSDDLFTFSKEVSWSPVQRSPPFSLRSSVNDIRCTTGEITYINRLGDIVLLYNNTKSNAFEVRGVSKKQSWFTGETSYHFELKYHQVGTNLWDSFRGKMIRLMVTCQRANPIHIVNSCILMKISGTETIDLSTSTPATTQTPPLPTSGSTDFTSGIIGPIITTIKPATEEGTNTTVGLTEKKKKSSFPAMLVALGVAGGLLLIAFLVALIFIIRNRKRGKRHKEGDNSTLQTSKSHSSSVEHRSESNGNKPVSMYSQRCYEEIVEIQPILAEMDAQNEVIYDNQNIIERGQEVIPLNEYASCDDSKVGSPQDEVYTESVNPYYKPSDEPHPAELSNDNPYYTPSGKEATSPSKPTEEPQYEDLNSVNPLYTPMSFAQR